MNISYAIYSIIYYFYITTIFSHFAKHTLFTKKYVHAKFEHVNTIFKIFLDAFLELGISKHEKLLLSWSYNSKAVYWILTKNFGVEWVEGEKT